MDYEDDFDDTSDISSNDFNNISSDNLPTIIKWCLDKDFVQQAYL